MEKVLLALIFGGVLWAITYLILGYLSHRDSLKVHSVQILSEEVSKHLLDSVKDYQNSTSQAMRDFIKDANDLLTKLKEETNKTVL